MKTSTQNRKSLWLALLVLIAGRTVQVFANPTGLAVSAGRATTQQLGALLNVSVSQTAILNWQSFNIAAGETTSFLQPSANSVVFNIIGDRNPSQIFGHLNANGTVILANANGFYFGPDSMIKVGGSFIATTAPIPADFGASSMWQFTGMPPLANIVNYGQIEVGPGRSLFLIAEKIENHGSLAAPEGNVELAAGQSVLVSDRPDGRGLSASVTLPGGSVDNFGRVTADAGTIALQARVVNQDGILQANSLRNQNGVIELVASDTVNLGANSQILATGDHSVGGSAGGRVTIKSDNVFRDAGGSSISTAGGANGGNGGNLEISAPNIPSLNSAMDASAQGGFIGGAFFLDPVNIVLGTTGGTAPDGSGTVDGTGSGSGTLNVNVNTAFKNFSQILLEASGNITLSANTAWNLSLSAGGKTSGRLTLAAGGDIVLANNARITDANNWSVTLEAAGSINLGTAKSTGNPVQLAAGSLNLLAGNNITVGNGSIFTTRGGSIFAQALAGNINAGTANGGYVYNADGSVSVNNPGGIATAAGGDVTLIAGNNVTSIPTAPSTPPNNQSLGASGAYGAGNVTVIAGNQITGNYNLANGTGTLLAGVQVSPAQAGALQNAGTHDATLAALATQVKSAQNSGGNLGTDLNPIILASTKGSWNAWAANNINLLEVQNPNGTYNGNSLPVPGGVFGGNEDHAAVPATLAYLFNYAPDAAVHLWAGNGITLGSASQSLTRQTGNGSMPSIYAPVLSLDAGAGGVTVEGSLFLYPSSQGSLQITTRHGGNLVGAVQSDSSKLITITMSGSGLPDWSSIYNGGQAITPWHLNDPHPVTLDISGSIGSLGLNVPTFAQITVFGTAPYIVGNQDFYGTYNFGFSGRNLFPLQTTAINVTGNLNYRGDLTAEPLVLAAADVLLLQQLTAISARPDISDRLLYVPNKIDPTKDQLVYVGDMDPKALAFLLSPTVYVFDQSGNRVFDASGKPVTTTVLTAAQKALLQSITPAVKQLAVDSQSAKVSQETLALAGPGVFQITADNIDLGNSGGITVIPLDAALAKISPQSAELDVRTFGDLTMTASKIANLSWLGKINLNVGGTLDVGGQFTAFDDPSVARGIYTTGGGNVSVLVNGDANVNGSRIAAYNGGDISLLSSTGDINAGTGGAGYVSVNAQQVNANGQISFLTQSIAGSGFLATTLPGSSASLGNITINAPEGSVNANRGGVLQIAFNDQGTPNAYIDINAGHDINASGSGIIGSNIRLTAGGNINGAVIGSQSININARQNVDVTAVSGGSVDINAAGTVAGTIVGGGDVSVSGDSITAAVMGGSVSASGDTSAASIGVPQSNVSRDVAETTDATAAMQSSSGTDEDLNKKKSISLAQKVSRVTVILPTAKKVSEVSTKEPKL